MLNQFLQYLSFLSFGDVQADYKLENLLLGENLYTLLIEKVVYIFDVSL